MTMPRFQIVVTENALLVMYQNEVRTLVAGVITRRDKTVCAQNDVRLVRIGSLQENREAKRTEML